MTYCLGLKYGQSVYLFADSAVTKVGAVEWTPTTSFGEKSHVASHSGEIVEEAALKIVPVDDRCFIAISGDIRRAIEGIGLLRTAHAYDPTASIPQLLNQLEVNLDENPTEHFAYLIARNGAQGAELWRWESCKPGACQQVQSHTSIGSLKTWHVEVTMALTGYLQKRQISEDRLLTVVATILQSHGLHDYLVDKGVGGTYYGVQLDSVGAHWLPDTNYIVHGGSVPNGIQLISVYCRGAGVAVWSSFTYETRIFLSGAEPASAKAWLDSWFQAVQHEFNQCAAQVWVFLGTAARTMFIVDAGKQVNDIPGFRVTVGAGRYDFYIGDPLKAALEIPLVHPHGPSFRVTYCSADNCLDHAAKMLANANQFPGRVTAIPT